MTYQDALDYLYSLEYFGIKLGLDNIRRLMELLGDPQYKLRVIHIGGTNGKGSVSAYTSTILKSAGFKVGLYTSPHLTEFEERIQINGQFISPDDVIRLIERIKPLAKQIELESKGSHPTYFEIVTALAFLYFYEENVDFVVLEVGLGGRLDATNLVHSNIAVITNIDFDHMKQLGPTLRDIAREKAGIIKHNSVLITGATGEALDEIRDRAFQQNATVIIYPENIYYRELGIHYRSDYPIIPEYQEFSIFGRLGEYPNLKSKLLGQHQYLNATLAVAAIESWILHVFPELNIGTKELLPQLGCSRNRYLNKNQLDEQSNIVNNIQIALDNSSDSALELINNIIEYGIPTGIENTYWPGRLEIMQVSPLIILDGAHNPAGAHILRNSIKSLFQYDKLILIYGLSIGKEMNKISEILCPIADEVVVTAASNHRVIPPEQLEQSVKAYCSRVNIVNSVSNAVEYAIQNVGKNDMICIAGSLYILGEARPLLKNI